MRGGYRTLLAKYGRLRPSDIATLSGGEKLLLASDPEAPPELLAELHVNATTIALQAALAKNPN